MKTYLNHIALQFNKKREAKKFFLKVLGLTLTKENILDKNLSEKIFGISEEIEMLMFENKVLRIEVFISQNKILKKFDHVCLEIDDKTEFLNGCDKYGVKTFTVKKGDRELLFMRDYSNNLYEIKVK